MAGQYTYALYGILALLVLNIAMNGGSIAFLSTQDNEVTNQISSEDISELENKMDNINYKLNALSNIEEKVDSVGASIDLIDGGDIYVSNNDTTYISITQFQFFLFLSISSLFGSIIGSLISLKVITKFILNKNKK